MAEGSRHPAVAYIGDCKAKGAVGLGSRLGPMKLISTVEGLRG